MSVSRMSQKIRCEFYGIRCLDFYTNFVVFLLAVDRCCTADFSGKFRDKLVYLVQSEHSHSEQPPTCE